MMIIVDVVVAGTLMVKLIEVAKALPKKMTSNNYH